MSSIVKAQKSSGGATGSPLRSSPKGNAEACARKAPKAAKFRLRTMSFAAGGGILARNEVTVTNHKEILGGTKPTSEACARKVPKAAKHRLPQDGRGRRRLLSTEGANGHALALFELFSWLDGWDTPARSEIIRVTGRSRYSRGTVHVQLLNLLTAVILFDSKLCAALAANRG